MAGSGIVRKQLEQRPTPPEKREKLLVPTSERKKTMQPPANARATNLPHIIICMRILPTRETRCGDDGVETAPLRLGLSRLTSHGFLQRGLTTRTTGSKRRGLREAATWHLLRLQTRHSAAWLCNIHKPLDCEFNLFVAVPLHLFVELNHEQFHPRLEIGGRAIVGMYVMYKNTNTWSSESVLWSASPQWQLATGPFAIIVSSCHLMNVSRNRQICREDAVCDECA